MIASIFRPLASRRGQDTCCLKTRVPQIPYMFAIFCSMRTFVHKQLPYMLPRFAACCRISPWKLTVGNCGSSWWPRLNPDPVRKLSKGRRRCLTLMSGNLNHLCPLWIADWPLLVICLYGLSLNSPEKTPNPRRDSENTGPQNTSKTVIHMVSPCFLGVSSWVWGLFWGISGLFVLFVNSLMLLHWEEPPRGACSAASSCSLYVSLCLRMSPFASVGVCLLILVIVLYFCSC